ncbi:MAG: hypothetical protein ACPHW5_00830 [Candidatus Puniceispirillales bacterium]
MIIFEWWVIATIIAALTQTFRSAVQRQMKAVLGDDGASYIRFLYALPFAWLMVFGYQYFSDIALPGTTLKFWIWVNLASLTQILFTVLLIRIFSQRSFAAGTAFSKTEVLQAAILETIILGVMVSLLTGLGIILGVIAVIMLAFAKTALTRTEIIASCFSRTSAIGIASGTFLGLATVCYKAAAVSLIGDDLFMRAVYTGGIATTIQVIVMGAWMLVFTRPQFIACFVHWRGSIGAGLFGAIATIGWFTAFMMQTVASVRAVGQVELLITLAISFFWFKEKTNIIETIAILLLTLSIVMVLLGS